MEVIDGGGNVVIGKMLFWIMIVSVTGLAFLGGMIFAYLEGWWTAENEEEEEEDDEHNTSSDRKLDIEC